MVQGIAEELKKQAEQRISSRFIMYVLDIHDSGVRNTLRVRRFGKSAASQKRIRARRITWIPRRSTIAQRSRSSTSTTSNMKCACTNNDTRSPTWKNLTEQQVKRGITCLVLQSGQRYRDQYMVVQTNHGGGSNTEKTEAYPEYKKCTVRKGRFDQSCPEPDAEQWSRWSSWTWSLSTRSFWVGFFVVAIMARVTITCFVSCTTTLPLHKPAQGDLLL